MASKLAGAASGAASGATAGAALGPWGAAVGGVIGGALGFLSGGGDPEEVPPVVTPEQIAASRGNIQSGQTQQQSFLDALAQQNGIGNQSSVFAQQQALAAQLQNQANGTGANPALAQLQQTTGQNVANQASLAAGVRGSAQNAGLIARQAALSGGNIQQQAVGQGATLAAQQQIAAQQQLMAQQANQAQLATNQVNQQQTGIQAYNTNALANQGQLIGSATTQASGQQAGANAINAQNNQNSNNQMNGLLSGAGAAVTALGGSGGGGNKVGSLFGGGAGDGISVTQMPALQTAAHGGMIMPQSFAQGGAVASSGNQAANLKEGPKSKAAQHLHQAKGKVAMSALPAAKAAVAPMVAAKGGPVPGKAAVKGNSLKNDTVAARLSPGEIVIPRSITQGKDAPAKAAAFVQAILAKQGMRK